jgi:hypothetical protein
MDILDIAKGIELAKEEEEGERGESSGSSTREDYLLNGRVSYTAVGGQYNLVPYSLARYLCTQ